MPIFLQTSWVDIGCYFLKKKEKKNGPQYLNHRMYFMLLFIVVRCAP